MGISSADKERIEQLRQLVKDQITPYYDTDFNLLRWLKGHDYDLKIILPKLINHLKLRTSDWQLDKVADAPRNHKVHDHWKSGLTGPSVLTPNTIVNIEQSGNNDYWGLLKTYPINDILRARVYDLESMLRSVMEMEKQTGEQCSILYIMDLSGIVMDRHTITLMTGGLSAISAFMSEHYVEMVHSFVLVNVPTFISAIWSIAKPLLPEKTRLKVNILGGNWREEVQKLADPNTLPSYWNLEGNDGPFKANVEIGLQFPETGYYSGGISKGSEVLSVSAGKTGYVDMIVKKNSKLRWEVHASGHFAFCIYKLDKSVGDDYTKMERAYPLFSKVPGPTLVPCIDEISCDDDGIYRFWFGNEHAWLHTLKITHLIRNY
ncbi:unnamed protein product [Auanema sp. JU1783]|nr:unnamed protein product [Auanema sp. JU1783]